MPNETLSQALVEAYANAPSDIVVIHTLEIRHPDFSSAIRIVKDRSDLEATLEASAPLDAGKKVKFISFAFQLSLPPVDDKSSPSAIITIDNVSRDIVLNIEKAVESQQVVKVTYRPYLSNDLTTPQYNPPLHLTMTDIVADVYKVTGKARFGDFANLSFPSDLYTASRFPGLAR